MIETEIWGPHPKKKGYLTLVRRRTNGEVFKELHAALKKAGLEPDEYFSCSEPDAVIPKKRWIACYAVTGGSEGHYIHIETLGIPHARLRAQTYVVDEQGRGEWRDVEETRSQNVAVRNQIALGKTFAGMDKAQEIANFCAKELGA